MSVIRKFAFNNVQYLISVGGEPISLNQGKQRDIVSYGSKRACQPVLIIYAYQSSGGLPYPRLTICKMRFNETPMERSCSFQT